LEICSKAASADLRTCLQGMPVATAFWVADQQADWGPFQRADHLGRRA
jgi:hypothetical protein